MEPHARKVNRSYDRDRQIPKFCTDLFQSKILWYVHMSSELKIANLLQSIGRGTDVYDAGKRQLEIAIREYDQAVYDLTASVVASNGQQLIP